MSHTLEVQVFNGDTRKTDTLTAMHEFGSFGQRREVRFELRIADTDGPRTEAINVDLEDVKRLAEFLATFVREQS